MSITVPVPELVLSRYVVATDEVPKDPYAMARAQTTGPPGEEVIDRLDTPLLRIRAVAAADSVWRRDLAAVAAAGADQERIETAAGHVVIESETPREARPRRAQAVRAVARALAEATGGLLADLCTAQVLPRDRRTGGERDWFCAADRWVGIDCLINADAGADAERPTECACLCLFTRGLRRFGLPELVIDQVACAYDLAATNLMRGLAVRLLARLWAEPGVRELHLDETVVVEPADMWGYWAARPLFGDPVPLRLAEATRPGLPGDVRHLELLPHPGFHGTRAEWCADVVNQGLPSVAGWQPDTPPVRIDAGWPAAPAGHAGAAGSPPPRFMAG